MAKLVIFSQDHDILAQSCDWVELSGIEISFIGNIEELIADLKKGGTVVLIQLNPGRYHDSIFDVIARNQNCKEMIYFRENSLYVEISRREDMRKILLEQISELKALSKKLGRPIDPRKAKFGEICSLGNSIPSLTRGVMVTIVEPNKLTANKIAGVVRLFRNAMVKTIIPSPNDTVIDIPQKTEVLFISNDLASPISGPEIIKNLGTSWRGIAISMGAGNKPANMQLHFPHKSLIANNIKVTEVFVKILLRLFESMDVVEQEVQN